ncbi:MAG: GNAT family N-acetyltransferase [Bacteroidales bacterium]|nr:GNAT family N-acetyltransferase [Bacteroidales bacterium]
MSPKDHYRELCEASGPDIPVFQQAWWMDVACAGKEWDVALATDGNRPLAALPYLIRRRFGMRYIIQPQLTQFSGPVFFFPSDISERRRADFEHSACETLIAQLKKLGTDYFCQRFSPTITDWLPFYWAGFSQTTRYTYRIDDISDPARVFESFDRTKERQRRIRRIADQYTVDTAVPCDVFVKFHSDYWNSRGQKDITPPDLMKRVIDTATARNQGITLGLRDNQGNLQAAWFAVYDSHCAYALLSAKAPDMQSADISALLIWRLIETLSTRTAAFDFEGSMEPTLEYFYRSFGAIQVPLMEVSKIDNPIFPLLLKLRR